MMRTNHVKPDPLKTMAPGTGWGMDFQVVMDAAAAGESVSNGTFSWYGIAGTWFWIDPVADLAFVGMVQHDSLGPRRGPRCREISCIRQSWTGCWNFRLKISDLRLVRLTIGRPHPGLPILNLKSEI